MTPWPAEVLDRALGAYLGLALGDALGATVEFMTPREIQHQFGVHRDIVGGGWLKLPRGAVTDDTTMSLALGRAIIDRQGFNTTAVADSFVAWLHDQPVDCGNTCRRGIQRYITSGTLTATPNEANGGNGALMRNLPVVLASLKDEQALAHWTIAQCHITHHHRLSDAATLAVSQMVRSLVLGEPKIRCEALAQTLVTAHPVFRFAPYPGRASGYVVDTVQTVLHYFFAQHDFEQCLVATVNQGEDADTTGAVVGMLAGARCGAHKLPSRWLRSLDRSIEAQIRAQTTALLALAARY